MGQNLEKCLNLNFCFSNYYLRFSDYYRYYYYNYNFPDKYDFNFPYKQFRRCPISNNECYAPDKPALIFKNTFKNFIKEENKNKYKIVLITESPYNLPGCPIHSNSKRNCRCSYWANSVEEFIEKHLAKFGFGRFGGYFPDEKETQEHIPRNIFSFIFYIFYPIFKQVCKRFYGSSENDIRRLWAYSFINKVYWTHVAKRSLKGLNEEDKKKAIEQCIPLLKKELEAIQPNLIIVATRHFWEKFGEYGYESYKDAEKEQEIQFNNDNSNFLLINMFTELFQQSSPCPSVVVFPNPSPLPENYKNKVSFYKKRYVPKLIKKIHEEIERNYDRLPDC